uniref:Conserved oligomeric Golgi complex subunit 6 n=1 Tax=Timema genevievae TaxID=629358 RepID=A0A7R9JPX0_TIMGE|nr:unnamed protein product [Timema genevievae]
MGRISLLIRHTCGYIERYVVHLWQRWNRSRGTLLFVSLSQVRRNLAPRLCHRLRCNRSGATLFLYAPEISWRIRTIERKLCDFLSSFRDVKEALDSIYNDVSAMNSSVQNMTSRLQATKTQTRHLIEQTTKLQAESPHGEKQDALSEYSITDCAEIQTFIFVEDADPQTAHILEYADTQTYLLMTYPDPQTYLLMAYPDPQTPPILEDADTQTYLLMTYPDPQTYLLMTYADPQTSFMIEYADTQTASMIEYADLQTAPMREDADLQTAPMREDADLQTAPMREDADLQTISPSLGKSSEKLTLQQEVAGAFLRSFQLSPSEQTTLRGGSRDTPITSQFFVALERVQSIHTNCRTLMQSGHQTAALDIMEQMALYQESALERLYRWTQTHCRNIESPETSELLAQAMACLQDRPVLFKYVLDEYCTSRRSVLVRAFIDALTQGGPGGTPKPIEMHAHDPKRYVGDMLAWLHQFIPGEKENLLTLLKGCQKLDVSEHIQQTLSNITEGVCHPLRVRMEQILTFEVGPIVLYGVTNLARFYKQVIVQVVGASLLESTLIDLEKLCYQTFLLALESQVKRELSEKVEAPPSDLSPSPRVSQLINLLKEVLAVATMNQGRQHDIVQLANALVVLSSTAEDGEIEVRISIVGCIVDPLIQSVNESASSLSTTDMAVYLLNCIYQMQSTLSLYEFMDDRLERLQAQSDAQLDTLTSEQASFLVANLNLGPIYTILQEQGKGTLSSIPGMEHTNLKNFLSKLDSFLVMPDMLMLQQIGFLLSGTHRSIVQRRSFEVIAAIYKQLYEAVHNPENRYQNPELLMPRTPEDVHQLIL